VPAVRDFRGLEIAAHSFGLGALVITLWMLALSWCGLPFALSLILGPWLGLAAAVLLWARGRVLASHTWHSLWRRPAPLGGWERAWAALLLLLFLYATLRAVLYPLWAWDAIATWGCKAKVFYESRALNLGCIDAHNYYPNLVPLFLSYLFLCLGQANDHLVNGVFPFWGALLLGLLYSLLRRLELNRGQALGVTVFLALNGVTFTVHLYIAYADLPLACYALGATGLLYLWLTGLAPRGSLALTAACCAAMAWAKYEGPPLAATALLAAALTLAWLRPPHMWRRLAELSWPLAGLALGYLPWRLYVTRHFIESGTDHIQKIYPQQFLQALPLVLQGLGHPYYFGFLWPALALTVILLGRRLWSSPLLVLALFLGGNLLAILLAYTVAPTSAAEFPGYVRATLDRLLLHLTPTAALLLGAGLKEMTPELTGSPSRSFGSQE
jgi:hypothetical protein